VRRISNLVRNFQRRKAPDPRSTVFDVAVEAREDGFALVGHTTDDALVDELLAEARRRAGMPALVDDVARLPVTDADGRHGLIRTSTAPLYGSPTLPAPQISELLLGMRVEILDRADRWLRVRCEDGYLGWLHAGYAQTGDETWACAWERGERGESVVSLGAEWIEGDSDSRIWLPWGARLTRHSGAYRLLSDRSGTIGAGEVVDTDRLSDRFPQRGESIARTARRWLGAPYLWGGVTPSGVDCSGLAQAVLWMHGIAAPRDSDQQQRLGAPVPAGYGFEDVRPGDLLFFAERGTRITHVAFSLGAATILHASVSNWGVAINDLTGGADLEDRLRRTFVFARRVVSDDG
jgi:hypothetical protein